MQICLVFYVKSKKTPKGINRGLSVFPNAKYEKKKIKNDKIIALMVYKAVIFITDIK